MTGAIATTQAFYLGKPLEIEKTLPLKYCLHKFRQFLKN